MYRDFIKHYITFSIQHNYGVKIRFWDIQRSFPNDNKASYQTPFNAQDMIHFTFPATAEVVF